MLSFPYLFILPSLLLSTVLAQQNLTLHHRFLPIPPPSTLPPFLPRGIISLTPSPYPTATYTESESSGEGQVDDGKGWYQVALDLEGEIKASTRACFLASSGTSYITLHMSGERVYGIEVKQSTTPRDGACTKGWEGSSIPLPSLGDGGRVEVGVKVPEIAQSPTLAPPPIIDETTGQPAIPPVEKSFLQKYWLPIIGIAIFFMAQMGPESPSGGGGGAAPAR